MATRITRDELKAKLDTAENLQIFEALPPMYYEDAHHPGAINIPHNRVDELAPILLPDKDREIVAYCSNLACQNSTIAATRLTQLGYTRVRDYEAGKQDWMEAGLPVERGAPAVSTR